MKDYFEEKQAKKLSSLSMQALLYEVSATPKPGLVDRNNTGAHKDMDIFTFEDVYKRQPSAFSLPGSP